MSNTRLVKSEKLGEKDVFIEAAGPKKVNMTMPGNQNARGALLADVLMIIMEIIELLILIVCPGSSYRERSYFICIL